MPFELIIRESFSSAHRIPDYPGNCERMHGHNYQVEVVLRAEKLNSLGFVIDFREARRLLREITGKLDHRVLNECEPFSETPPSAENIAKWIFHELKSRFPAGISVVRVTVWETGDSAGVYFE